MPADLFEILATEQALGEGHGRLLHEHGRADPTRYAQGILLYVQAKAAFDGLIESAKHQLSSGGGVDDVPDIRLKVRSAVDRRTEFTTLVREQVLGDPTGTRMALGDLMAPAKLLAGLLEGMTGLRNERRKEQLTQLDGLKWRPFEALMTEHRGD